jgi:hypothetical protein
MSLKLKRDETSTNPPAPNQLEVGELVMNSKTGKLYTKLSNGIVFEFAGRQVCYAPVPIITFDDVTNFCCNGDSLSIKIKGLQASNTSYVFNIDELTNNSSVFSIADVGYDNYTENGQTFGEATVVVSVEINGSDPITIFKFSVELDNSYLTEKTISICCKNCTQ